MSSMTTTTTRIAAAVVTVLLVVVVMIGMTVPGSTNLAPTGVAGGPPATEQVFAQSR